MTYCTPTFLENFRSWSNVNFVKSMTPSSPFKPTSYATVTSPDSSLQPCLESLPEGKFRQGSKTFRKILGLPCLLCRSFHLVDCCFCCNYIQQTKTAKDNQGTRCAKCADVKNQVFGATNLLRQFTAPNAPGALDKNRSDRQSILARMSPISNIIYFVIRVASPIIRRTNAKKRAGRCGAQAVSRKHNNVIINVYQLLDVELDIDQKMKPIDQRK